MNELKEKVEAILFAVGKKIDIAEIAKLCHTKHLDDIKSALLELKADYEKRKSPMKVYQYDNLWKLSVSERHLPLVHNLVSETELSKSLMETLAVIAWRYPILQSDVIHIRTNKAYDHLTELESMGFITRTVSGRTRKIKLTEKFFNYFDLPSKDEAQQVFRKILPKEIREKILRVEQEIHATEQAIDEAARKKELEKSRTENKDSADPVVDTDSDLNTSSDIITEETPADSLTILEKNKSSEQTSDVIPSVTPSVDDVTFSDIKKISAPDTNSFNPSSDSSSDSDSDTDLEGDES
ncbi:MAG: SMC-Scp complex subunit ScpB [Nanoarchaeota archaeon]|nr:SMC-Scp complex subunit ScpB [Nanoarchaeota archaeon]